MPRLTLDITDEVRAEVDEIREQTGASTVVEVFRRMVKAYKILTAAERRGASIQVVEPDGSLQSLVNL